MTIVYDKLMALEIEPVVQVYEAKDCMLMRSASASAMIRSSEDELAFVYEKNLKVLPTMATVIGHGGRWRAIRNTGIDWLMVVNGEQGFTLRPSAKGQDAVIGAHADCRSDRQGAGQGRAASAERTQITDKATGDLIGAVTQTIFCRGDGGFGGPPREAPAPHPIPARAPDAICDLGTRPEMALIYRLSGDYNPLHAEPAFAKAAGFPRPILHGLGTFGVSGHALLKTMCGYDPARLASFACRFSAPVFPGETIRTEMWRDAPCRQLSRPRRSNATSSPSTTAAPRYAR